MPTFKKAPKTYQNRSLLVKETPSKTVLNNLFAKNIRKRLCDKIKNLPPRTQAFLQDDTLNVSINDTFDKLKNGEIVNPVKIVNSFKKYDSSVSDVSKSKSAFIKSISLKVPSPGITKRRKYSRKNVKNDSSSYVRPRLEQTPQEENIIDVSLEIENMHSYNKSNSSLSTIFTNNYMERQTVFSSTPLCPQKLRRIHNHSHDISQNILEKSYEEIEQWESKKPDVSLFTPSSTPSKPANILPLKPIMLQPTDFEHAMKDFINTNNSLKISSSKKKDSKSKKKDSINNSNNSKVSKKYKNVKLKPVTVNLEQLLLSSKDNFNKISVSLDLWNKFETHSKSYLADQSSIFIFENRSKSRYPLRNSMDKEENCLSIVQNKSQGRYPVRNGRNKLPIYNSKWEYRKSSNDSDDKLVPKNMIVNLEQLPLNNSKVINRLKKDIKQPIINLTLNNFNEMVCKRENPPKVKQPIINLTLNNFDHLISNKNKCMPIYDVSNSSKGQQSFEHKSENQSLLLQKEIIYFNQSTSSETNETSTKFIYGKRVNEISFKTRAKRNRKKIVSLDDTIAKRTRSQSSDQQLEMLDFDKKKPKRGSITKKNINSCKVKNQNSFTSSTNDESDNSQKNQISENMSFESVYDIIGIDASQRSFYRRSQSNHHNYSQETNDSKNKEEISRITRSMASETNDDDKNKSLLEIINFTLNNGSNLNEDQKRAIFEIIGCDMSQRSVLSISEESLTDSLKKKSTASHLTTRNQNKLKEIEKKSPRKTKSKASETNNENERTKSLLEFINSSLNNSIQSFNEDQKRSLCEIIGCDISQISVMTISTESNNSFNKSNDERQSNSLKTERKSTITTRRQTSKDLDRSQSLAIRRNTLNKKDLKKPIYCDTSTDESSCDINSDSEPSLPIKPKISPKKKKSLKKKSVDGVLRSLLLEDVNQKQNTIKKTKLHKKQSIGNIENLSPKNSINLETKDTKNSDSVFSKPLPILEGQNANNSNISESGSFLMPLPVIHRKTLKPGKDWRRSLSTLKRSTIIIPENAETISTEFSLINDKNHISKLSNFSPNKRSSIRVVAVSSNDSRRTSILEKYAHTSYVSIHDIVDSHLENSVRKLSINQPPLAKRNPLTSVVTAREVVLRRCGQTEPLKFEKCYPESLLKNCQKIGEGVYGEVFLFKNPNGGTSVMKVIPIEGDQIINGERQKKFEEIISEIIIAMELSNLRNNKKNVTSGFSEVQKIRCVQGRYPEKLIDLWDLYEETKGSENDSPIIFNNDQLYIVLELANGGKDLEAYLFNNALQAFSMFKQVAISLAIAECELNFEHRDLHWGNVLLTTVDKRQKETFCLDGKVLEVETHGVEVAIIDFTLSRIEFDGVVIFNDLSLDPDLFTATGDYQFEIYRQMQKKNGDNWYHFEPFSNLLWLHYTLDKSITALRYRYKQTKVHKEYIKKMCLLKDEILKYHSVKDFVLDNF